MNKKLTWLLGAASLLGFSHQADAAGFALIEQSVSSMGNAYAGGAAIAEDATTIFFNPAGITRLCGNEVVAGFHIVLPYAKFDNDGSVLFPGVNAGPVQPINSTPPPTRLRGNDGGNAGENALVGNFYASRQLNNCFWVGLGVTSPFGLVTDYDHGWKGRYHALRSSLLTIDINPVAAWKINRCWSIGGGFRAVYAHAKLTSSVDYGTIAWLASLSQGAGAGPIETALNNLGFLPQTQDGGVKLKGNAWGWGGNVGILFEPRCGTRFGANWRSQVMLHVKGSEKFHNVPALIADPSLAGQLAPFFAGLQAAAATDSRAKSDILLPDIAQISAYHEINRCWAVMGDITWYHWNTLKKLRFRFSNDDQPDGVTTLKWENTLRYALGVTYSPNYCWKIRTGVAYDETPIPNKKHRTPRIPDQDRIWATLGFGYQWNNCIHFDFGYAHLFIPDDPKVDKTGFEDDEDFVRGGLKGKWDAHTDIVSAQVVYRF